MKTTCKHEHAIMRTPFCPWCGFQSENPLITLLHYAETHRDQQLKELKVFEEQAEGRSSPAIDRKLKAKRNVCAKWSGWCDAIATVIEQQGSKP